MANQISGSLALEWATATIGTDAISPTYSAVLLGTESGATSDTLQTITATGVYNGALLTIRQRNATEEINLIHATSTAATATGPNIYLNNKGRVVLDNAQKSIDLRYDSGTASGWVELGGTAGPINTSRATVASAATTADIWGAAGNQIDWTGTVTCTGFPAAPQAGVSRTLICNSAAPFTAGANMEIDGVASGATVTCAAKDKMIVESITTTQFRLSRVRYDGAAQNGDVLLSTTTAAATSTEVNVETGFGAAYDDYYIVATGVYTATKGSTISCQLKLGGSYLASAYNFHLNKSNSSAATYSGVAGAGATSIQVTGATHNGGSLTASFIMQVLDVNTTARTKGVIWKGRSSDGTNTSEASGNAEYTAGSAALTGVKFISSAGNITGTFKLYGRSK